MSSPKPTSPCETTIASAEAMLSQKMEIAKSEYELKEALVGTPTCRREVTPTFKIAGSKSKSNHLARMSKALQSLRLVDKYTDATIICHGKTFPVHRNILHANSEYFADMFQTDMKEATTGKVNLDCVDASSLKMVLDFIYTGDTDSIDDDEETLLSLLATAHLLRVDFLCEFVWDKLINNLRPTHFLDLWNLAERYDNQELLIKIPCIVAKGFPEAADSMDFCLMSKTQLKRILLNEELMAFTEVVISKIMKWVFHLEKKRLEHFPDLLSNIVLETVSNAFLVQLTKDPTTKKCPQLYEKCVDLSLSRLQSNGASRTKIVGFTTASKVVTYDIGNCRWEAERLLPFALRKKTSACEWNGCIYFVGGEYDNGIISHLVYHYMPLTNTVQCTGKLLVRVVKIEMDWFDGCLLILGREKNQFHNITVQKYHPLSGKSTTVGVLGKIGNAYHVRAAANKIYFVLTRESSLEINEYTPSTHNCKLVTTIDIATNGYGFCTTYGQEIFYVKNNTMHVYDTKTKRWLAKRFKRPDWAEIQSIFVSNKDANIPFHVLWVANMRQFALYELCNAYKEIPWHSIDEGNLCNCIIMKQ